MPASDNMAGTGGEHRIDGSCQDEPSSRDRRTAFATPTQGVSRAPSRSAAAWAGAEAFPLWRPVTLDAVDWRLSRLSTAEAKEFPHIRDTDGHDYVDFALGDTGGMCGHAPEAVTRAARLNSRTARP